MVLDETVVLSGCDVGDFLVDENFQLSDSI